MTVLRLAVAEQAPRRLRSRSGEFGSPSRAIEAQTPLVDFIQQ